MKKFLFVSVLLVVISALSFAGAVGEYKGNTYLISHMAPTIVKRWFSNGETPSGTEVAISGDKFYFISSAFTSASIISKEYVISGDQLELVTGSKNPKDAVYGTYTGPKVLLSAVTYDITANGLWVVGYADSKTKNITLTDIFTSKDDLETKVRKIE